MKRPLDVIYLIVKNMLAGLGLVTTCVLLGYLWGTYL